MVVEIRRKSVAIGKMWFLKPHTQLNSTSFVIISGAHIESSEKEANSADNINVVDQTSGKQLLLTLIDTWEWEHTSIVFVES